jgi:hypothetical protein
VSDTAYSKLACGRPIVTQLLCKLPTGIEAKNYWFCKISNAAAKVQYIMLGGQLCLSTKFATKFFRHHISLLRIVEIVVQNLGHLKHVHLILLENRPHRIVATDLPSIARILKLVGMNVFPKSFDGLWTRKLNSQHVPLFSYSDALPYRSFSAEKGRQGWRKYHRLLHNSQRLLHTTAEVAELTWNPVFFGGFFSPLSESSMSESSEALIRADVFFLGVFFFLAGALFLELLPRVGRASLASSACSFAAYNASASMLGFLFFFLRGDPLAMSEMSSLPALRFWGVAASGMEAGES